MQLATRAAFATRAPSTLRLEGRNPFRRRRHYTHGRTHRKPFGMQAGIVFTLIPPLL
jgi:hypothetical protein